MTQNNFQNNNQTSIASGLSFENVIEKIRPAIPENFESLSNEDQYDLFVRALDEALSIDGQWFLVNGEMSLKEFFRPTEQFELG